VRKVLQELRNPRRFEERDSTKTGKSRMVKIPAALADALRARGADGWIFLRPDGRHIGGEWFRSGVWYPALKAAGLEGSGIVPRDMRRTHASWLRDGGSKLEAIRNRLGHGDLRTTDRYLASISDTEDEALSVLEQYMGDDGTAA
jgi:integrase